MRDPEDLPKNGFTFNQFKDWALIAVLCGAISVMVMAVYDLDKSVNTLVGEIRIMLGDLQDLKQRVGDLEKDRR
jgi:hypothetical protein